MEEAKLELLQGTPDVRAPGTVAGMRPLHGYGIARRIEQTSCDQLMLHQGTIHASLVRLQQRAWIRAEWGTSDSNRRAKFYALAKRGEKRLADATTTWSRLAAVMNRVPGASQGEGQ